MAECIEEQTPRQFTIRGQGLNSAEVRERAFITLTIDIIDYKRCRSSPVVAGQLKSLSDGSVKKCEVLQSGPEYYIQYTPTVRGRHELSVSIDGQQVAGSPFPVSVSIHPMQLGKPVKVWTGLTDYSVLDANSTGLIIAEHNGDIVILDEDEKRQKLLKRSKHGFKRTPSVAMDKEDNIYCICDDKDSSLCIGKEVAIMRSNRDSSEVQICKVKLPNFQDLVKIEVVGDKIKVFEDGFEGIRWRMYDKTLNFKTRSDKLDNTDLCFMNTDLHGHIYCCEEHIIKVLNKDGVFLYSFGYDSNGLNMLAEPRDVCVSGHYVYVTSCLSHNVSVFTTTGDYVTSFGRYGKGRGEFIRPLRIFTDLDNYIYVWDEGNGRVQCF